MKTINRKDPTKKPTLEDQILWALKKAGKAGITQPQLESMGIYTITLRNAICNLRKEKWNIQTIRVGKTGYGRYILNTDLQNEQEKSAKFLNRESANSKTFKQDKQA